jgi:hypothetical protein
MAYREGIRHVARLQRLVLDDTNTPSTQSEGLSVPDESFILKLEESFILDNLHLAPISRPSVGSDEVASFKYQLGRQRWAASMSLRDQKRQPRARCDGPVDGLQAAGCSIMPCGCHTPHLWPK